MQLSIQEKKRLKEKYGPWAVVTGASSGIGLELATRLAECGLNLILAARHLEQLSLIEQDLTLKYKVQIYIVEADVSTSEGIEKIIKSSLELTIGLLVLSAGFGTSGLFISNVIETEINMLRVNCEALLALTHNYSKAFANQKRGGIILLSSIVAFQGVPYSANYAATKAYVQTLGEALAIELKPFGVDVLCAAPGPVETGFGKRADMKMTMSLTPGQVGIPILRALGNQTTVLPGFLTKLLVYSLRTVPRFFKIKIMEKVMRRMTEHQKVKTD